MREGIDTFLADVADNVVFTGARSGFRIEGKEAFRTFLTYQWQNYPTRHGLARQVTRRVFQEGNVVVVNGYNDQTFIDKSMGHAKEGFDARAFLTFWPKLRTASLRGWWICESEPSSNGALSS